MKQRRGNGARCAYCGALAEGNYSIDRDGFGVGPTVELCDACGGSEVPTCGDIWARIGQGEDCVKCDEEILSGDARIGSFHEWCFEGAQRGGEAGKGT
jgi:hypothetical protein